MMVQSNWADKVPLEASTFRETLGRVSFSARQESWVGTHGGQFYKIFRKSGAPLADLTDPECIAAAKAECETLELLSTLSSAVCRPLARLDGCIILPELSGPDMYAMLRNATAVKSPDCLDAAMAVLAELHAHVPDRATCPVRDYTSDTFAPLPGSVKERMSRRRRVIITDGFEVRNLRFDARAGRWRFFDPHIVELGSAEQDIARFVVSLLMINWGHGGRLRVWTDFDLQELLLMYNERAVERADMVLLDYFLFEALAMRSYHATNAVRRMPITRRLPSDLYRKIYFFQMERWIRHHGI